MQQKREDAQRESDQKAVYQVGVLDRLIESPCISTRRIVSGPGQGGKQPEHHDPSWPLLAFMLVAAAAISAITRMRTTFRLRIPPPVVWGPP